MKDGYKLPRCENVPDLPRQRMIPRSVNVLNPGDKVWLLAGRPSPDDLNGPSRAIDPNSLTWVKVTVDRVLPDGYGNPGVWVKFPGTKDYREEYAWYPSRFVMTESAARVFRLPEYF